MTRNLINIGSHGNRIALYKETIENAVFFIKEAYSIKSNKIIDREYQGYDWYFNNILKINNTVRVNNGYFFELVIPEFQGRKYKLESKFHLEHDIMTRIVKFYREKWPINEEFAIHGDMGLSNFIINKDEIILIDWEHFHKSDHKYYGVDIINMLFISFKCRIVKGGNKLYRAKNFIRECYRLLFDNIAIKSQIVDRPFYRSKIYLKKNYYKYLSEKTNVMEKFALASFPDEKLNQLDQYITR